MKAAIVAKLPTDFTVHSCRFIQQAGGIFQIGKLRVNECELLAAFSQLRSMSAGAIISLDDEANSWSDTIQPIIGASLQPLEPGTTQFSASATR